MVMGAFAAPGAASAMTVSPVRPGPRLVARLGRSERTKIAVSRPDSARGWESPSGIAPPVHAVQHNRVRGRGGKDAARTWPWPAAAQLLRRHGPALTIVGLHNGRAAEVRAAEV